MKITRTSILTRKIHEKEINIEPSQLYAYVKGALIQDAAPQLTNAEREFIINGITEEEWNDEFPDEGESEEPSIKSNANGRPNVNTSA